MSTKIGDKVIVMAYNPQTNRYETTEVVVLEVSRDTVRYQNPHCPPHWGTSWDRPIDPTNPTKSETNTMSVSGRKLAAKYRVSLDAIRAQWTDFVQHEGYADDGTECQTFGDYLDYVYQSRIGNNDPIDGGRGAGAMGQRID